MNNINELNIKKIGMIFALNEELTAVIKRLKLNERHEIFDKIIFECEYQGKSIFLLESGIGKVNAARSTQILIDYMKVDCVFNIGVAGSLIDDVKIGDIVIGTKLVQHDFDLTSFGREKGEIPGIGKYIESDKDFIQIAESINTQVNIHKGIIASGDIFVSSKEISENILKEYNSICVEMEGAAIAQVCFLSEIPFIVLRAISDSPNEQDNKTVYESFLKSSSEVIADFIEKILVKI